MRDCLALLVDGGGSTILLPHRCYSIQMSLGGARKGSHWMCLCKFSSNFRKNQGGDNSLMVRDCLALSIDGRSAAITSEMAMFDQCVFWEVGGKAHT